MNALYTELQWLPRAPQQFRARLRALAESPGPLGRDLESLKAGLALEPAPLLLDEPWAGLNRAEREDLARLILRIEDELGLAMIWIEHDLQMVADLADRIHVLDYGRTLGEGSAAEVLNNPAVIAAYIGTQSAA